MMKKLLASIFTVVLFCGIFASTIAQAEIIPSYVSATEEDTAAGVYSSKLVENTMQYIAAGLETIPQDAQTKQIIRYIEADFCIIYATYYLCLPDQYRNNSRIQKLFDKTVKDTIKTLEWALKKAGSSATFDTVIGIADEKMTKIGNDFDKAVGSELNDIVENSLTSTDLSDRAVRLVIYMNALSYAQKFHPNKDELIKILAKVDNL